MKGVRIQGEILPAETKGGDYRGKSNQATDNMLQNLKIRGDES
jgi:hypothetical protein